MFGVEFHTSDWVSSACLCFPVWVSGDIILSYGYLPSFLRDLVFNPDLFGVCREKFANKLRIPQLTRDPEIFTASPECRRLAPFDRCGDRFRAKVVLLASGY